MSETATQNPATFRKSLRLRDLILYGIVIIQPTAPMPIYGVVSQVARGHVVTAILIAMVAMLFTAISYGRLARIHPSAGSAYTYVSRELHPGLGFMVGWSITLDYLLNPLICTIWCAKAAGNFFPAVPYAVWVLGFVILFACLNLGGIESSARINFWMATILCGVVVLFLFYVARFIASTPHPASAFLLPFYDPRTFSASAVSSGTAIAVLTYIGFDAVSTLSEEARDPRRDILRATVLTCLITGVLASLEVYAGQLVWPDFQHYPDVDTAFVYIAQRVGHQALFAIINITLLVATIGSGFASQLAAARLLYGMGRENVIPQRFFGVLNSKQIPRNNVLFSAAIALVGALLLSYATGAELLNFGAFIAFMGVNVAALSHEQRRGAKSFFGTLSPLLGFLICFYIWIHLSFIAKIAGTLWLAAGLVYGAWNGSLNKTLIPQELG